jgi:hypothetical protein
MIHDWTINRPQDPIRDVARTWSSSAQGVADSASVIAHAVERPKNSNRRCVARRAFESEFRQAFASFGVVQRRPLHDEIVGKLRGMNLKRKSLISKPSLNQKATTS